MAGNDRSSSISHELTKTNVLSVHLKFCLKVWQPKRGQRWAEYVILLFFTEIILNQEKFNTNDMNDSYDILD